MAVNGARAPSRPELVSEGFPEARPRWVELATSGDHKDVGRMLITGSLSFLVIAMVEFGLMRLQLAIPESDFMRPAVFDRMLTMNAATLVFLFALPFAFGLFTYVAPLQVGARSLAYPRLANLSFWLFVLGGLTLYVTFLFTPPDTGFNPLPPLSDNAFSANNGVDAWLMGCGLALLGMVLLAVNLAVTLRTMRAPGMVWRRVPLFSWAAAISSYVLIVAGAAMLAAMVMLEIDRTFSGVFFDAGEGGAPLYWQHLSSIFFTGVWLLLLLPAIGAISEIVASFSGKPPFGRRPVAGAMVAIAGLGLLAWMQNMFTAPIPKGFLYAAQAAALLLLIPFGLVFFNWIGTLAGGALRLRAPMLFALASISTLAIGLAGELMHSVIPVAWQLAGTTDATANTGFVVVGGGILGGFAALYYWYPKMTGRTMGETLARLSLVLILIGTYATFVPMALAGLEGQPVDVYKYYDDEGLDGYNLASTIGAFILFGGILVTALNAVLGRAGGARAGHDPWSGETLEWYAPSPPPLHNFDVVPDVRSAEPLRDIRAAVRGSGRGAETEAAPAADAREPVA